MTHIQTEDIFTRFFPLVFVLWWMFVISLVSYISGWKRLSRDYHSDEPFDGRMLRMRSVSMRWASNYGNCVNIGVNEKGLYLSVFFIFRPCHPPLLIPWEGISVKEMKSFFSGKATQFSFAKCPGITVTVSRKTAESLRELSPASWPSGSEEPAEITNSWTSKGI
jgi:hypothetical protein